MTLCYPKPGSDGRQEGRMNEHRDVTSFLVSHLNQALTTNGSFACIKNHPRVSCGAPDPDIVILVSLNYEIEIRHTNTSRNIMLKLQYTIFFHTILRTIIYIVLKKVLSVVKSHGILKSF